MNTHLFRSLGIQVPLSILVFVALPVPGFGQTASPSAPQDPIEKAPLILGVGEQRLLRIPGLLRFSLGSPALRAHPLPKGLSGSPGSPGSNEALLLRGTKPGPSDLWVWKSDAPPEHRKVRVEQASPEELKPGLQKALAALEEVEVILAGGRATLRGEIFSVTEAARIQSLTEAFPKEIQDETLMGEAILTRARESLERWAGQSPYKDKIRIEDRNGTIVASGAIENARERASIEKRLRAIFPAVQLELSSLPDNDPTVHFKVFLLELKKNRFRNLGLSWPGSTQSAFRVTTSGIEDLLQLDLALESLEEDGSAKILSNPELVVRAPGEAELFSGGELPIEMQSHFYSNVTWKNFGLTLKLKVTHSSGERIRLEIFTEVSHLDPSIASNKLPGLQANRMKTQVDARFGKPILLSGLLQQNLSKHARGLPWLRDIPVLGPLFGSEDFQNEKSELVAILLPSAVPPEPPMQKIAKAWHPLPSPFAPGDFVQPQPDPVSPEMENSR